MMFDSEINSLDRKQSLNNVATGVAIFAVWLLALGVFLWPACSSPLPPIYDAIGYVAKGKNVWESLIAQGNLDLLDVQPTIRPPGTILMSYPLGYSEGTHGFYFRSIFIPACLFGLAILYVTSGTVNRTPQSLIFPISASICGTTLPLFFQFSLAGTMFVGYWGLVDSFIGGVAAVAVALLISSFGRYGRWSRFAGLCLAALCIYIKPAGALVFGVCAAIFLIMEGVVSLRERERLPKAVIRSGVSIALAGLLLAPAFLSPYLGAENLESGRVAVGILKSELYQNLTLDWSLKAAFHLLGWIPTALIGLALGAGVVSCFALRGKDRTDQLVLLLFVSIWFVAGLIYLLNTSFNQVRYAFAFWLPAVVCTVAIAARSRDFLKCKPLATAVMGLVAVHAFSLLDQLLNYGVAPRPSAIAGWNTRVMEIPELEPFHSWLSEESQQNRSKRVFFNAAQGNPAIILNSAILYDFMVEKRYQRDGFYLEVRSLVNWIRPSGIYFQELADVDYILANVTPVSAEASALSRQLAKLQDGLAQVPVEKHGLVPVRLGPNIMVYEVVGRADFLQWLEAMFPDETNGNSS
jgi:pimeloyl-ACP methyl ester carboxylesterase